MTGDLQRIGRTYPDRRVQPVQRQADTAEAAPEAAVEIEPARGARRERRSRDGGPIIPIGDPHDGFGMGGDNS